MNFIVASGCHGEATGWKKSMGCLLFLEWAGGGAGHRLGVAAMVIGNNSYCQKRGGRHELTRWITTRRPDLERKNKSAPFYVVAGGGLGEQPRH